VARCSRLETANRTVLDGPDRRRGGEVDYRLVLINPLVFTPRWWISMWHRNPGMAVVGSRSSPTRHFRHGSDIIEAVLRKNYDGLFSAPTTPDLPALSAIRPIWLHLASDSCPPMSRHLGLESSLGYCPGSCWRVQLHEPLLLHNKIAMHEVYR
jgi:hypothetical protein